MAAKPYLTAPVKTDKMPPGIPYIVGNEAAERFTFYGLRAILVVFMTQFLLGPNGQKQLMSEAEATEAMHIFLFGVYFFPFFGAILSDGFLGKYRTILTLSFVYLFGPLALALDHTRTGLWIGLWIVVIGSGGIKPCVSAHVGDQFGPSNHGLLPRAFSWFYFSVNTGSTLSMALTPKLLTNYGPGVAFGVPAALMFIATVVFWLGRYKFIHIPPGGLSFVRETFSAKGLETLGKVISIFVFIPIFWSLFDQTASRWVLQGEKMGQITLFGAKIEPAQMQTLNPIFVLLLIPLFSYVLYPAISKVFPLTPLRKIGIGFFVAMASFLIPAWVEQQLVGGGKPSMFWQVPAYALLTSAEILISITALEFSYTQAPKTMKSLVMSLYLLAVALGNLLTAGVNKLIQKPEFGRLLEGPKYYLFFAGLTFLTGIIFIFVAMQYRGQTILHEETQAPA